MDSFEYFKSLIQQDINELEKQNYDNSQIEKINNFFDLFLNSNLNFDSRVNINIEQRINHLYESEKKGINPHKRNRKHLYSTKVWLQALWIIKTKKRNTQKYNVNFTIININYIRNMVL